MTENYYVRLNRINFFRVKKGEKQKKYLTNIKYESYFK